MKKIRKKRGISRAELSRRTGIPIRTLEAYEQGRRDPAGMNVERFLRLADELDCSCEILANLKKLPD